MRTNFLTVADVVYVRAVRNPEDRMLGPRTRSSGGFYVVALLALKNLDTVNGWVFAPPPSSNSLGSFPHQRRQFSRFSILATQRAHYPVVSLSPLKVNHYHQRHSYLVTHVGTAASPSPSEEESSSSHAPSPLLRLLRPAEPCNVDRMSGTDLAYVGDVVYELFVRSRTVWVSTWQRNLQNKKGYEKLFVDPADKMYRLF